MSLPLNIMLNIFLFKIEQKDDKDFVVKEKENLKIPVIMTMPISCNWPKDDPYVTLFCSKIIIQ